MSSLLTQVVRRQALMMVPRRHDSALIIAGPPKNIISKKVRTDRSSLHSWCVHLSGETLHSWTVSVCADALSDLHHAESPEVQWFEPNSVEEEEIPLGQELIQCPSQSNRMHPVAPFAQPCSLSRSCLIPKNLSQ